MRLIVMSQWQRLEQLWNLELMPICCDKSHTYHGGLCIARAAATHIVRKMFSAYAAAGVALQRWTVGFLSRRLLTLLVLANPRLSLTQRKQLHVMISHVITTALFSSSHVDSRLLRAMLAIACPEHDLVQLFTYLGEAAAAILAKEDESSNTLTAGAIDALLPICRGSHCCKQAAAPACDVGLVLQWSYAAAGATSFAAAGSEQGQQHQLERQTKADLYLRQAHLQQHSSLRLLPSQQQVQADVTQLGEDFGNLSRVPLAIDRVSAAHSSTQVLPVYIHPRFTRNSIRRQGNDCLHAQDPDASLFAGAIEEHPQAVFEIGIGGASSTSTTGRRSSISSTSRISTRSSNPNCIAAGPILHQGQRSGWATPPGFGAEEACWRVLHDQFGVDAHRLSAMPLAVQLAVLQTLWGNTSNRSPLSFSPSLKCCCCGSRQSTGGSSSRSSRDLRLIRQVGDPSSQSTGQSSSHLATSSEHQPLPASTDRSQASSTVDTASAAAAAAGEAPVCCITLEAIVGEDGMLVSDVVALVQGHGSRPSVDLEGGGRHCSRRLIAHLFRGEALYRWLLASRLPNNPANRRTVLPTHIFRLTERAPV